MNPNMRGKFGKNSLNDCWSLEELCLVSPYQIKTWRLLAIQIVTR